MSLVAEPLVASVIIDVLVESEQFGYEWTSMRRSS